MPWLYRLSRPGRGLALLLLLIFATLLVLPTPARAQSPKRRDWNDAQDSMKSAIGLHYGKLAGHGLSFRFPIRWWLYAQVGGGIWHTSEDEKHNLGFELNYILRQDDQLRLYLGAGSGYFYHRELIDNSSSQEVWVKSKNWNVGAGVGLEYLMGVRWALQAELDFVHTGENGNIKVAPQVGLHFYW